MKKVLFIAPAFFGYYNEIKKELEKQNYEVDFFFDSSNNSNIFKALSRLNKKNVKILMKKYYNNKVKPIIIEKKYDFVFFIYAMSCSFSTEMIKDMRDLQKEAKFIAYQWDGEKNIMFVKKMHKYFDDIYTFDRIDYLNNNKYKFLPLFYIDMYKKIGELENKDFKYDVSYIGTAHPKKLYFINKMAETLKEKFPKQYIFHYIPSRLKYYYHKLKNKEYRKVKLKDLELKKLPPEKVREIFANSKCIFDAPQEGQNGLTIRTIECLGARKKIITANTDIVNYDFYNKKNIYIFKEGNIDFNDIFFKSEYEEIPKEIYDKYSIKNWVNTMIN